MQSSTSGPMCCEGWQSAASSDPALLPSVRFMIENWSTPPADAAAYFAHRLAVETDVSDVAAGLDSGAPGFILLDSRSTDAWAQGHVSGAVRLPGREIAARAEGELDRAVPVVTITLPPPGRHRGQVPSPG